eukprot:scaffold90043_cov25-Tisochrysis_lutea.AAC.8
MQSARGQSSSGRAAKKGRRGRKGVREGGRGLKEGGAHTHKHVHTRARHSPASPSRPPARVGGASFPVSRVMIALAYRCCATPPDLSPAVLCTVQLLP